jgi:hypothetical protein
MVSMKRLGKFFSSFLAIVAAASLAACGGGSHSALPQQAAAVPNAPYLGPLADATFKITIPPPPKSSGKLRRPNYVSSSTSKIVFTLNTASRLTAGQVTSFNTSSLGAFAVTLNSATCPGSGPWTCTLTIKLPPGSDNLTIQAEDSSNNVLSQQIQTFTVTVGGSGSGANSFSTTLDANANVMTVATTSGFCASSFNISNGQSVPTVGTSLLTFNVSYTDLAGKTIIAPGRPILSVNGHTDDNGGAGYTITGTGGNATVKVNQSTQSYTLQATTSNTTATINVAATPANTNTTSDGLGFNKTLSYTFQSGPAPPASFLADAEQIINGSGVVTGGTIHLWTLSLGASDTFTAGSPSSLASTNPGAGPDVDFPNDLLFDPNADLLIANGGAGNPDFGNFACVPAGAITTGANVATVIASGGNTNTFDDPQFLALGTDSSVAITNTSFGSGNTPDLAEFILSGTYVAAPSRNILHSTYGSAGTHQVVTLPTTGANPAGSYAVSITDTTQAGTHVLFYHPDGSSTALPSSPLLTDPFIAYDPQNDQIVAADSNGTSSNLSQWSVSTRTQVGSSQVFVNDGSGNAQAVPTGPIAVSSDGHVAVVVLVSAGPEVYIYDGTSSHNPQKDPANGTTVEGPIAFDATTTAFGSTFVYGGAGAVNIVKSMRWISASKLLICLYSQHSNVVTSANGLYIFDVSQNAQTQSGFDPFGNAEIKGPKQTGFQALSNAPLATAYKP